MTEPGPGTFRALGEEIGLLLQHAKDQAHALTKRVEEEAATITQAALSTATEAEARARVIEAQAQREAAQIVTAATAEATRLVKEAEAESLARLQRIERRVARLQQIEVVLRERLESQSATPRSPSV